MPSQLKSDTARANGAKSKGPRTQAGKEKSSKNSLRHGFTSRNTIILEYEDPEEFQQLLAEYHETYEPATAAEKDLVDQMVAARWRVRRIWTIETALLDCEIVRRQAQVKREFIRIDGAVELAEAFRSLTDNSRSLAMISRYEARLSRMHDRAYAALRELQTQRKSQEEKNSKRTHPGAVRPQIPPRPQIQANRDRQYGQSLQPADRMDACPPLDGHGSDQDVRQARPDGDLLSLSMPGSALGGSRNAPRL